MTRLTLLSFVALVPLILVDRGMDSLLAFPVLIGGLAFALIHLLRGLRLPDRLMALDVAAILLVGIATFCANVVGRPFSIPVAAVLVLIPWLGTVALAYGLETARGGIAPALIPPLDGSRALTLGMRFARAWDQVLLLRWDRALAYLIVAQLLMLGLAARAFEPSVRVTPYVWLVSSYSFWPLLLLSLACLMPGLWGAILSGVSLLFLETGCVWQIASTEVFVDQGRPLPWDELRYRLSDPASWAILREGLLSWTAVLLTLVVFAGIPILALGLRALSSRTRCLAWARLLAGVIVAGHLLVARRHQLDTKVAERYLEGSLAPWHELSTRPYQDRPLDWEAARELRTRVESPFWREGPAPLLHSLAGMYLGRSVVVVAMESQRSSDVAGLGEGAFGHLPLSPHLSRMAGEGLLFTNYYQASASTNSLLWTLLTGLPEPVGRPFAVQRAPEATRLGRLPDFNTLGYRCDWLCPAPPRWDNWDRLLASGGARWWFEGPEVRNLSHERWTAWGMPDEQLYAVALRRYREGLLQGRPQFLGLLTVSNHHPFKLPPEVDGVGLSSDHVGGMRYADHCLNEFVKALRALPENQQPIVFITADTSHSERLREAEPMGTFGLEGLRVPGLLLLPDRRLAGERYEGLFCHEDLLDLLYLLIAPREEPRPSKFIRYHRAVVCSVYGDVCATERTYLNGPGWRWFRIEDRWRLVETPHAPDRESLETAWRQYRADDRRLWRAP